MEGVNTMAFNITYTDGTTEQVEFSEIDVPEVNRKNPVKICFGPYGVSTDGQFYFGDLVVPFAFYDKSTELIFFRRVRELVDPNYGTTVSSVAVIGLGLRSTVDTHAGPRNHIQLIWVYPTGEVKIGGNK
jgi:hypothetical protein